MHCTIVRSTLWYNHLKHNRYWVGTTNWCMYHYSFFIGFCGKLDHMTHFCNKKVMENIVFKKWYSGPNTSVRGDRRPLGHRLGSTQRNVTNFPPLRNLLLPHQSIFKTFYNISPTIYTTPKPNQYFLTSFISHQDPSIGIAKFG